MGPDSTRDQYVRYALLNNPAVEAAYEDWRAVAERGAQVGALPDPRVTFGYFLEEVETRVGPQEARVGARQTFPWPGKLRDREDAADSRARAAWRRLEAVRLAVTERVVVSLHNLRYLDQSVAITRDNVGLLRSFEAAVRARYRVGAGNHPELIRVQVELGLLEDRLANLETTRPSYVAELNAVLNRDAAEDIPSVTALPDLTVDSTPAELISSAHELSPALLGFDDLIDEQRSLESAARKDGFPDVTLGVDYIFTGEAKNRAIAESGDDPVLFSVGVNLPIWRKKIDASVRQAVAKRRSMTHRRADTANRIAADVRRAWVDHTDADRRVRLYEGSLIPKANESLRASLAGFRAGDVRFLDLLDTERTLLEFAISAERARAERGKALARLSALVGRQVPTHSASESTSDSDQEDGR